MPLPVFAVLLMLTLAGTGQAAGASVHALSGSDRDYDPLLAVIGSARVVMLGEATHGSREFYRERARITRRLVTEAGFNAVVLEAPWEPIRRADAYVRGEGSDPDAAAALGDLERFPRWLWRNVEMEGVLDSLRAYNRTRAPDGRAVRLFGMDLYSVPESARAVVRYLRAHSEVAAIDAKQRYACFTGTFLEPMLYGREVESGRAVSCAEGAERQLAEMQDRNGAYLREDAAFAAWQSARVVRNGEDYYRALYRGEPLSWNRREAHMADTLSDLLAYLGPQSKLVVWAHNSHQGDARETDQGVFGETSLGQLMRERYGDKAVLVGFSTHRGTVRAAPGWGEADRVWRLRPAVRQSWPGRLHRLAMPCVMLLFRGDPELAARYAERRLERVVGVMYVPGDERGNHYRHARLSRQFDALIHIDKTHALAGRTAKTRGSVSACKATVVTPGVR